DREKLAIQRTNRLDSRCVLAQERGQRTQPLMIKRSQSDNAVRSQGHPTVGNMQNDESGLWRSVRGPFLVQVQYRHRLAADYREPDDSVGGVRQDLQRQ